MKKIIILLVFALLGTPVFAGDSGIIKLSLWGKKLAVALPNHPQKVGGADIGIGSDTDVVRGLQWDLIYSYSDDLFGMQTAIAGKANRAAGVQWSFVNLAEAMSGVQFGLYNQAEKMSGLQLGVVNNAQTIHGLQIGLVNIAGNGWLPVMVLVNGRF